MRNLPYVSKHRASFSSFVFLQTLNASVLHKEHTKQLGHGNRLTNIRYADDLMLFATASYDLIYILGACSLRFATELGEDKNFDNVSVGQF